MFAFAEHAFKLAKAGEDGVSLQAKLEAVENRTGKRPAALDGPPLPEQAEHVWEWFQELSEGRSSAGLGPSRLSWLDIYSWCALRGISILQEELRLIRTMDRAWMGVFASQEK